MTRAISIGCPVLSENVVPFSSGIPTDLISGRSVWHNGKHPWSNGKRPRVPGHAPGHFLETLPFLDVQVHLINNHIETDLHKKPTDKHQYLLKTSCHPNHTKKAILCSLFLRIRRICSTDAFFDQRSRELIEYLIKRGYSRTSLQRDAFAQFHVTQPFNRKKKIRQD